VSAARVLGIGSPFGDDRVGWAVIDALRGSGALTRARASATCYDRPGLRLVEALTGAEHAILVDAMRSGAPPGSIRRLAAEDLTVASGLLSAHGFGVAEAVALARALGALPRRLTVIGIEIADPQPGADLSAPVRAAVAAAAAQIERELARPAPPSRS
jgi:hydrogenase maturation protease